MAFCPAVRSCEGLAKEQLRKQAGRLEPALAAEAAHDT
jgi:hypothetical protein